MAKKIVGKKNKKSYDDKLIKWISIGLGAFVAIVVAIVIIISTVTGYVAKVDGLKIYDYEYVYFLQQAFYEEQNENFEEPEGYDDMTTEEQEELIKAFWTDERKNDCAEEAMEKARQFKAQYRLARAAGYKLSLEEKNNIKSNINSYYNMYLNYGMSEEMIISYYFGGMTLSEYKDFAIIQSTIELYKAAIKEGLSPTDDELRAIYDENPDDYRTVSIRQFTVKVDVKKPTDEKADDYQTKLDEYNKAYEEALEYAKEIMDTYNAGNKMSTYKKDDDGKFELDKDGNKIVDKADLSFEDYIKAESDDSSSSSTGGLAKINNINESSVDEITKYALSMIWNEDRTQIIKKDADDTEDNTEGDSSEESDVEAQVDDESDTEEKEEEENTVMTELEIIETETAIYVIRAEDITDYDNSVESEEGAADSIKDNIKNEWLEEKAVEDLESKVNAKGDEYKVYGKKEDEIKEINDSLFSTI